MRAAMGASVRRCGGDGGWRKGARPGAHVWLSEPILCAPFLRVAKLTGIVPRNKLFLPLKCV